MAGHNPSCMPGSSATDLKTFGSEHPLNGHLALVPDGHIVLFLPSETSSAWIYAFSSRAAASDNMQNHSVAKNPEVLEATKAGTPDNVRKFDGHST